MLLYQNIGKLLIILGACLLVMGVIFRYAGHSPVLEKLLGMITWQKGPVTLYFPLGACLLLSALLTFLFCFWGRK